MDFILIGLWLLWSAPSLRWFLESIVLSQSLPHLTLTAFLILFLFFRFFKALQTHPPKLDKPSSSWPIYTFIFSLIGAVIARYRMNLHLISCLFTLLGSYSLLGIYLPFKKWRRGWFGCLILILLLPLEYQMDTYLGFPLRMLSVSWTQITLRFFKIPAFTHETILNIENSFSQVSAACSGMKGLWTGVIVFILWTWIRERKTGLAWFGSLSVFLGSLISSNTLRIVILVILTSVFHFDGIAQAIHAPLGILGFVFSCALGGILLEKCPPIIEEEKASPRSEISPFFARAILCLALMISWILTPHSLPASTKNTPTPTFILPASWNLTTLPLTPVEASFFKTNSSEVLLKAHFEKDPLNGSLLIVQTTSWKGHHDPKICLQGNGMSLEPSETKLIDPDFPIQWIPFTNSSQAASFWFQSTSEITEDFSARIWKDLFGKEQEWVMVSIVFENAHEMKDPVIMKTFFEDLKNEVKDWLNSSGKPWLSLKNESRLEKMPL